MPALAGGHAAAGPEGLECAHRAREREHLDEAHPLRNRPRGVRAVGRRRQEDGRAGRAGAGHFLLYAADRGDRKAKSLGLSIVGILTTQLDGTLEQEDCAGTRSVLRFPAAALPVTAQ